MTRPLLLGHRGARASRHIPENTLASFELCLQHGCDGFEFDVRRSVDCQPVICHDPSFRGMDVAATPAAVLGLPTLDEVLRQFATRAFLDIELKVGGLERETLALLGEHWARKGYVMSSFLPEVLVALHGLDSTVPLGFICDNRKHLERWRTLPADWIIHHVGLTDQALIEQAHAAGKKLMVWTVNRTDEMRKLADSGVDAIISDETEIFSAL